MTNHAPGDRGLWLAIILLTSLVIAILVGVLVHIIGAPVLSSLTTGGACFIAFFGIGTSAYKFLSG